MIIDHMGAVMPEIFGLEFRVIGRVAFPIYVFLVAEGFRHTKSPHKFLARLGIFALISEPIFDLALGNDIYFFANTNIFYTLFLGGTSIVIYKLIRENYWKIDKRNRGKIINDPPPPEATIAGILLAITPTLIAEALTTDYGAYGVVFILCMYVIRPLKLRLAAMVALCVWQHNLIIRLALNRALFDLPDATLFLLMIPATLLPVLLAALYNGKRGPGLKWFFYASYPAHLLVIFVAALALRLT